MSFAEATHHRINQTLAEAGLRVIMPDKWADIDAATDKLNRTVGQRFSDALPIRSDLVRLDQAFAARLIERHHEMWAIDGRMKIDELLCAYGDATAFVYLDDNSYEVLPIAEPSDWRKIAAARLSYWPVCNVRVNPKCNKDTPVEFVPVYRGENICVLKSCALCVQTLTDGTEQLLQTWVFSYLHDDDGANWPGTIARPLPHKTEPCPDVVDDYDQWS